MATMQNVHDRTIAILDAMDDEIQANKAAIALKADDTALAAVAKSGRYRDLTGTPFHTLPDGIGEGKTLCYRAGGYERATLVDMDFSIDNVTGYGEYRLKPATASTIGGVKVGNGLSVTADGTVSAPDVSSLRSMIDGKLTRPSYTSIQFSEIQGKVVKFDWGSIWQFIFVDTQIIGHSWPVGCSAVLGTLGAFPANYPLHHPVYNVTEHRECGYLDWADTSNGSLHMTATQVIAQGSKIYITPLFFTDC